VKQREIILAWHNGIGETLHFFSKIKSVHNKFFKKIIASKGNFIIKKIEIP
jgi:hypothetical protein